MTALSAAGLVETFCAPGDYTVFAPTNDAFDALPPGTLDAVLADNALLTAILTYHVAGESLFAAEVVGLDEIVTLNGETITVEVTNSGVVLNGTVNIIQTDIEASNGVIHVIDGVLLPPVGGEEGGEEGSEGPTEEGGEVVTHPTVLRTRSEGLHQRTPNFSTLVTALEVAGQHRYILRPGRLHSVRTDE